MSGLIERFGPLTISLSLAIALFVYRDPIIAREAQGSLNFPALYSAAVDWAAIQTGFLFGIFGFVAGKNDGFIKAVRNTHAMRLFSGYMRCAMALGFVVTIYSIMLMVINFSVSDGGGVSYSIFLLWALLTAWAFLAFGRVAYIFGILIRTKDKNVIPG